MQKRALTILTCMVSANHWYAEDKFYRGINSYYTGSESMYGRRQWASFVDLPFELLLDYLFE